jgi:hypothetical protein
MEETPQVQMAAYYQYGRTNWHACRRPERGLNVSIYVDDMRLRYGRMIMCHMIADTEQEMHDFADHIGVKRRWFQRDHYDICLRTKARARQYGAIEVTRRAMVRLRRDFRNGMQFGVPERSAP